MRNILLVIVMFVTVGVSAQQNNKAKEILEKVSEKTRSFGSVSANFAFTMTNPEMEDFNERSEGSILVKGQKYKVTIPALGATIISDGTTLWNYMEEGNQVTISDAEEEGNELMNPSSMFTIYEQDFTSKYIGEKNLSGINVYEIELFPDNDEYDVSKITVYINKKSMMIHSALLNSTDGNIYGIEVKNLKADNNVSDTDFVFDASNYPDVEEIDFR